MVVLDFITLLKLSWTVLETHLVYSSSFGPQGLCSLLSGMEFHLVVCCYKREPLASRCTTWEETANNGFAATSKLRFIQITSLLFFKTNKSAFSMNRLMLPWFLVDHLLLHRSCLLFFYFFFCTDQKFLISVASVFVIWLNQRHSLLCSTRNAAF